MNTKRSVLLSLAVVASACGGSELEERRADVASAGSAVMPFDLERTTHFFEKIDVGGLQTVVANDDDDEQISLIRAHLAEEAERFARGDFHDPEMIHGADMAGLHELVSGHDRMTVTFREIERGGAIEYTSEDPALVEAIHHWFDAQLRDHGDHARARH